MKIEDAREGQRVRHPKHGLGTVRSIRDLPGPYSPANRAVVVLWDQSQRFDSYLDAPDNPFFNQLSDLQIEKQ